MPHTYIYIYILISNFDVHRICCGCRFHVIPYKLFAIKHLCRSYGCGRFLAWPEVQLYVCSRASGLSHGRFHRHFFEVFGFETEIFDDF